MIAQDYIDEVKLRMKRHKIAQEMSDAEILTYVNRARNQVQKLTMGLFPERYSRVWDIGIGAQDVEPLYNQTNTYAALTSPSPYVRIARLTLPADFIEMEVCKIRYNLLARVEVSEARPVTMTELYKACMHSFNYPNFTSPLYTVERVGNQYILYLAPALNSTELDLFQMSAEIWYVAAVMDLQNLAGAGVEDTDWQIPIEFQSLVMDFAELFILTRIIPESLPSMVTMEIKRLSELLKINYSIETDLQYSLLPSKET